LPIGRDYFNPVLLLEEMHAFSPIEDAPSLLDAVQILETETTITNANELNAQEVDAACIFADIPGNIGTLEMEAARNRETIATHAEQERCVVTLREAGQA